MGRNSRAMIWTFVFALALPSVWLSTQAENEIRDVMPTEREVATCGDRELKLFRSWSDVAGESDAESVREEETKAEILTAEVGDGRKIGVIRHLADGDAPAGKFVLVIPGNAWLAEHFLPYAARFAGAGLDVYVADFRGYGLSRPGVPTMSAIIQDYRELLVWIRRQDMPAAAFV